MPRRLVNFIPASRYLALFASLLNTVSLSFCPHFLTGWSGFMCLRGVRVVYYYYYYLSTGHSIQKGGKNVKHLCMKRFSLSEVKLIWSVSSMWADSSLWFTRHHVPSLNHLIICSWVYIFVYLSPSMSVRVCLVEKWINSPCKACNSFQREHHLCCISVLAQDIVNPVNEWHSAHLGPSQ